MEYNIEEISKKYDFEIKKIIAKIKKTKAKFVLLQFAEGLKPYAISIVNLLRKKTNAEFLIWFNTCFGACDTPLLNKKLVEKIDLTIQFGHNDLMPNY